MGEYGVLGASGSRARAYPTWPLMALKHTSILSTAHSSQTWLSLIHVSPLLHCKAAACPSLTSPYPAILPPCPRPLLPYRLHLPPRPLPPCHLSPRLQRGACTPPSLPDAPSPHPVSQPPTPRPAPPPLGSNEALWRALASRTYPPHTLRPEAYGGSYKVSTLSRVHRCNHAYGICQVTLACALAGRAAMQGLPVRMLPCHWALPLPFMRPQAIAAQPSPSTGRPAQKASGFPPRPPWSP